MSLDQEFLDIQGLPLFELCTTSDAKQLLDICLLLSLTIKHTKKCSLIELNLDVREEIISYQKSGVLVEMGHIRASTCHCHPALQGKQHP